MTSAGPILAALLVAITVSAQQPPPPRFRVKTQLVQVSVVARDKQGNPVTGLARDEFQILDNGEPQEIRLFLSERPDSSLPESTAPETRAPNTFTNRISSAAGAHSGYAVLLFDNNNTPFEHTARARLKAIEALKTIPAGDKIAIYSLWCKFQVVREFTADRDSLLQQLTAFAPAAGGCGSRISGDDSAAPTPDPFNALAVQMAAAKARAIGESNRIASLTADSTSDWEMEQMADHLAGIPGRKNLIWLASAFPLSHAALQRLLNAGVAIYPVDAVGSTVAIASEKEARRAPLRALAAATGGIAYSDRDDLDAAVREALADGRVSYTLGFYASGAAGVRRLEVRAARAGVTLRYRTSYAQEPPQPVSASPVADLIQALNRPVDATAIPITATATRVGNRLDLSVSFDVSALDLEARDGALKGKAELVARFLAADGVPAGEVLSQTVAFNLSPASPVSGFHKELKIPAKAVELKLLLANLATGKIGTLTIPMSAVEGSAANAK